MISTILLFTLLRFLHHIQDQCHNGSCIRSCMLSGTLARVDSSDAHGAPH